MTLREELFSISKNAIENSRRYKELIQLFKEHALYGEFHVYVYANNVPDEIIEYLRYTMNLDICRRVRDNNEVYEICWGEREHNKMPEM